MSRVREYGVVAAVLALYFASWVVSLFSGEPLTFGIDEEDE